MRRIPDSWLVLHCASARASVTRLDTYSSRAFVAHTRTAPSDATRTSEGNKDFTCRVLRDVKSLAFGSN